MIALAALGAGTFFAVLVGSTLGVRVRVTPWFRSRSRGSARRTWFQPPNAGVTATQFWGGSAAAGFVALVVMRAVTGSWFVAAAPAIAVSFLPRAYFGRERAQRLRRVHAAWPDGLRDLLASISAGRSLGQAAGALAETGPEPLQEAFARFPQLARMIGTAGALEVVKADLADPTSDRILEVLILAHERGGGIVRSILEDLVDATTKDLKLLDQLETEGLEMRINSRAVVVLPWLVLVFLTMSDGPFRTFYRSSAGFATLLIGAVLSLVGLVVLGRLGRRPNEERVFGSAA
ncbi:MAG: Flp pilus assembly protein TadB [Actinomycetia bacterium]|nr:Flp pilus assembly protein TadB [Actinomycetes bacterium]